MHQKKGLIKVLWKERTSDPKRHKNKSKMNDVYDSDDAPRIYDRDGLFTHHETSLLLPPDESGMPKIGQVSIWQRTTLQPQITTLAINELEEVLVFLATNGTVLESDEHFNFTRSALSTVQNTRTFTPSIRRTFLLAKTLRSITYVWVWDNLQPILIHDEIEDDGYEYFVDPLSVKGKEFLLESLNRYTERFNHWSNLVKQNEFATY